MFHAIYFVMSPPFMLTNKLIAPPHVTLAKPKSGFLRLNLHSINII